MHPFVEASEPQEPDRPEQGQRRSQDQEEPREQSRPDRQVGERGHSITSPRMRNFASATVETKPSSAITRAASK